MTGCNRFIIDFGELLSVESIAWIVQKAATGDETVPEFAYETVGNRVTFGCASSTSWHNLRVVPLFDAPCFIPGTRHREVALTVAFNGWGRENITTDWPAGHMDGHGKHEFRERILKAIEAARSEGFPEYVPAASIS